MTYNLDIINLFINYYINGNNLINISKNLNISISTLKRWYFLYKNNINNKILLTSTNSDKDRTLNKDSFVILNMSSNESGNLNYKSNRFGVVNNLS